MSDGVLAAIIAACATVLTSFLQIRSSFAKEVAGRAFPSSSRKKSRKPFMFLILMLGGAAVGGFALSQWLLESERSMQNALMQEMQARVATLTRSESQLTESRNGTRAEIESGLMKRLGLEGVVAVATVAPCKVPLVVNTPTLAGHTDTPAPTATTTTQTTASSVAAASACTENDASPITLCATVPMGATVTEVELFVRLPESDMPWANARVTAGTEVEQARFAEKPTESPDTGQTKQVCEVFANWSSERPRVARMLVRYSL
jgi:hypothetical protein